MNYIFLDVDGVLNNINHYKKQHKKYGGRFFCQNMPFNPRSLKNLRRIAKKTNSSIILTSSWRNSHDAMVVLEARLAEYGLKILSKTEYLEGKRGIEIVKWIEKEKIDAIEDRFIIIDDEMYDILDHFADSYIVKINSKYGLTYFKALEAIIKLRKEKK